MLKSNSIKVGLVDDHMLLRNALANLINNFSECQVVLEANCGKELVESLRSGIAVDILLLDFYLPDMDGLETAKYIKEHYPTINVLMLTMYDSDLILIRLLQAGVKGFLKKDTHPEELNFAIKSVMQSGFYYSPDSTGRLVNLFRKQTDGHFPHIEKNMLSEIEIQFLRMASTELTYKEIAEKMGLNPRAVDNLRDSLFQKLNARSRVGLAMYAIRHGLVGLQST